MLEVIVLARRPTENHTDPFEQEAPDQACWRHQANPMPSAASHSRRSVLGAVATPFAGRAGDRGWIRSIALGVFDTSEAHPWVGAQLSWNPDQPAMLRIFEGIGGRLLTLGVPETALFNSWSALVNYILGVADINAAHACIDVGDIVQIELLSALATRWAQLDPTDYSFLERVATHLPGHDDREQFLAKLDMILAGIGTLS